MTLDELRERIPGMSAALSAMLVKDGIAAFESAGMTLEDASPSVSMTLRPKAGGPGVRFTLGVEHVADDDADHEDDGED
jgi:hypothetical protein